MATNDQTSFRANQASFRVTREAFEMRPTMVYTRSQLATSVDPSCIKIYSNLFSTAELLTLQSAVPEADKNDAGAKRVFEDMLTPAALDGTTVRKHLCPMFFANFLTQKKSSLEDGGDDSRLFDIYDDETLIPTQQDDVSKIAVNMKMVGVKHGLNKAEYPRPIDLAQTISIKLGDTYYKWKMDSQEFPAELIRRVWEATLDDAKLQIAKSNATRERSSQLNSVNRTGRGTAGLITLCGTKYGSLTSLNRHIDLVHTGCGGLSYLPEVHAVDGSSDIRLVGPPQVDLPVATGLPQACTGQFMNKTPNTINNLLEDKENMIKTVETDSAIQEDDELLPPLIVRNHRYSPFTTEGRVRPIVPVIYAATWQVVRPAQKWSEQPRCCRTRESGRPANSKWPQQNPQTQGQKGWPQRRPPTKTTTR